jgi:hypothetical protein
MELDASAYLSVRGMMCGSYLVDCHMLFVCTWAQAMCVPVDLHVCGTASHGQIVCKMWLQRDLGLRLVWLSNPCTYLAFCFFMHVRYSLRFVAWAPVGWVGSLNLSLHARHM